MANFFDQFDAPAASAASTTPASPKVGPWTKYQQQAQPGRPWEKYRQSPPEAPSAPGPAETPVASGKPWLKYQTAPAAAPTAPGSNYFDQFDPPAAAPAPVAEDRSWLDAIMGVADQGVRGAATGATNILGLPNLVQQTGLSVLEWGLGKAGAPQPVMDAVGGYKNLIDLFPSAAGMQGALDSANNATADVLGVERPDTTPDNLTERVVNRVMEEAAGAAIPAGAALNKARTVGVQGAREISGLVGRYVESAAVNPARFARREGTMALGAGAGAATADEIVDRDTTAGTIADLFGALTGAGVAGGGSALGRVFGDLVAAGLDGPASPPMSCETPLPTRLSRTLTS